MLKCLIIISTNLLGSAKFSEVNKKVWIKYQQFQTIKLLDNRKRRGGLRTEMSIGPLTHRTYVGK